jgi:hypothetical protein
VEQAFMPAAAVMINPALAAAANGIHQFRNCSKQPTQSFAQTPNPATNNTDYTDQNFDVTTLNL